MGKSILFLLILCASFTSLLAQKKAITEDGQEIIIYADGTWKYAGQLEITESPIVMPTPPFRDVTAKTKVNIIPVELKKIKAQSNKITDTEDWFINNGLSLPVYQVPNSFRRIKGNCPDNTPTSYRGNILVKAIYSGNHIFLIYGKNFSEGRYLIITDKAMTKAHHTIDFKNYIYAPKYVKEDYGFIAQKISWVVLKGNIIYVAHSHNTYASSSKGMNAYITAIDLKDYSLVWRTKPLVCNTNNFEVIADVIVCGYGFTAEPDYLYTINRYTGAIIDKIKLKTGPDYIISKDKNLFVRTYNMDYVFLIKKGERKIK